MLQLRPTFSESWYRVKDLKPRVRAGAQISRQFYRGDRWYVVRDPAGNQFHRLSDAAYRFVGLLDGYRTVGEAWEVVGGTLEDDAPTQPEVIQILSQLYAANLVETDISPDATVLLRRHKVQQKRQMQGRMMNLLFPRIPLWDPDRFLCRWLPVVGLMLGRIGGLLWLLVVGGAIAMVAPHFDLLQHDFSKAMQMSQDPRNWLVFLAVFWGIKFFHECGHAFMCRRFGGEVHEMGIMFLVFVPTPYVDASTAWGFPSRWQRMAVGAGGMIFELFIAACLVPAWLATSNGASLGGFQIHDLLSYVIFIASITTLVFNANPLLRYDGYYMLSDWLEIPNLQMKSKEYLQGLIKRHIWRLRSPVPLPPIWQRVQLFIYGVLSSVYRVFVGVAIILMVMFQIPILGVLMAIGGLATWLIVPVVKLLRYLLIEPELHRKRGRAWATVGVIAAASVVLLGLLKFPVNVYAEGIADPQDRGVVHSKTPGFVVQIIAKPGDQMQKGDVILVCRDQELETKIRQQHAMIEETLMARRQANAIDQAQRLIYQTKLDALNDQLHEYEALQNELTVRAPIAGQLIAPKLDEMMGRYLNHGEEIGTVATIDRLEIHAILDQKDAQLAMGKDLNSKAVTTEIRFVGDASRVMKPQTVMVTPAAQENAWNPALTAMGGGEQQNDPRDPRGMKTQTPQFELRCVMNNSPTDLFQPGQRAYLKLKLESRPLAWQWMRRIYQLVQSRQEQKSKLVD